MANHYLTWRAAVAKQPIQPQTKLVLYTILNYFTDSGFYIMPPMSKLVEESGMEKETFIKHLKKACKQGFSRIAGRVLEQSNGR